MYYKQSEYFFILIIFFELSTRIWAELMAYPLGPYSPKTYLNTWTEVPNTPGQYNNHNYFFFGFKFCINVELLIVFQGIELTNLEAHVHQFGSGTQSTYFSEIGTFSKIKRT